MKKMAKKSGFRTMSLRIKEQLLYESHFDPRTGNIVRFTEELKRAVDCGQGVVGTRNNVTYEVLQKLRDQFPHRWDMVPSPSPELVDISLTDKCGFGCATCYQDSRPQREHGSKELVPTILTGFTHVPYQVALGGGDPTGHPDLPWILEEAHKLGTVPNYTTAGHIFRPEVIEATNQFCGGVALTYHGFKGFDWFRSTYLKWSKALKCQLNVHLIADKDVVQNLANLVEFQSELAQPINLVLLAYYSDVGRASMAWHMSHVTYMQELPEGLKRAKEAGIRIAFSEGLLPYFLSRPEIGINTDFAQAAEGRFSCYVDPRGYMWKSSFDATGERGQSAESVFTTSSQKLWTELAVYSTEPEGEACYGCPKRPQCAIPQDNHYFLCAYAPHNRRLPQAK